MSVARHRPPARVAALGVLTLGLYFAWYYFIAFREVDFHEGRRHSALLFLGLVPVAGVAFATWYAVVELRALNAARARRGLAPGVTGARHTGLMALGLVPSAGMATILAVRGVPPEAAWWLAPLLLALLGPAVAAPAVARSVAEYWQAAARPRA